MQYMYDPLRAERHNRWASNLYAFISLAIGVVGMYFDSTAICIFSGTVMLMSFPRRYI